MKLYLLLTLLCSTIACCCSLPPSSLEKDKEIAKLYELFKKSKIKGGNEDIPPTSMSDDDFEFSEDNYDQNDPEEDFPINFIV